ncbi:hypothetical protein ACIRPK_06890 [Kitasatospora sp. NPDC101801]|uniref:hypothetical protein n=1 Tax=Kitasatospora sp. NPDC101801 TaxID=3364103 RepID=UPI003822E610
MSNDTGEPSAAVPAAPPPSADPFAAPAPGPADRPSADRTAEQSWSGFAVTAFVLGLVGFVLPLWAFSAGFAVAALRRRKRRPQRGFGLAVTSLVLAVGQFLATVALVLLVLAVHTQLTAGPERGPDGRPLAAGPAGEWYLRAGDCIREQLDQQPDMSTDVTVVPCDEPHRTEIYAAVGIPGGLAYPGEQAVAEASQTVCDEKLDTEPRALMMQSDSAVGSYIFPQAAGWWLAHDHETLCFFSTSEEWSGDL